MTYRIDQHGILHDSIGGCQSASAAEEEFWAEIERLLAGIRKYGTHLPDCKMENFRDESDCTCGWRDLECSVSQQLREPSK